MKKPVNVDDLAASLAQAAATPLVPSPAAPPPAASKARAKRTSLSVFLRVPGDLYDKLEAEAVSRTKASGKGVTVQQIIIAKLTAAS